MYDYNKMPRPVRNSTDIVTIQFAASLIRIIDVDEKNQVFTTNLWLEMKWVEPRLTWNPDQYDGIKWVHIPSDEIWTPDIVLYNNAAGDPDITIQNDITISHDGNVSWKPPAIYKSFCEIDVTWFPYDFQNCSMKFGTWSYTGTYVDLILSPRESVTIEIDPLVEDARPDEFMMKGMDLRYYYQSAEWDLLNITAWRHEVVYDSCCGPDKYVDVTFRLRLRRKTLFFTCNLIIPCFLISFLTSFVFYLSDKKITFAISILVCVTVFFLILIEIMPPTSLVIPMFGKYLLTTICLLTISIFVSVISVNFHFRTGRTHKMSNWMRAMFLKCLPKLLHMEPPRITIRDDHDKRAEMFLTQMTASGPYSFYSSTYDKIPIRGQSQGEGYFVGVRKSAFIPGEKESNVPLLRSDESVDHILKSCEAALVNLQNNRLHDSGVDVMNQPPLEITNFNMDNLTEREHEIMADLGLKYHKAVIRSTVDKIQMIADHFRRIEYEQHLSDEWRFVSQVIDRIFLLIFCVLNMLSLGIIVQAPSLSDTTQPLVASGVHKPLSHTEI